MKIRLPLACCLWHKFLLLCIALCEVGGLLAQSPQIRDARTKTLTDITTKVWRTFSDTRLQPTVKLVPKDSSPLLASFNPKQTPVIFFNERLYEICRGFNSDSLTALAIIIGHELTHYQANHKDWLELAQDKRADPSDTAPLLTDKERADLEALADREGTLHAYLAGFDAFRLIQPLYERIYKTYPLNDNRRGYPAKSERIALTRAQVNTALPNALLLEAATFLFAINENELVELFLIEAIHNWPLASLQNNLAVFNLKKALILTNCKEMPFRLPIEWDRFNRLLTLRGSTDSQQKAQYLEQAISYATQAHKTDPDYMPATLNLAIAYLLKGRYGTAEDLLEDLTLQPQPDPNALFVKAVLKLKRTNRLAKFREEFASTQGAAYESFNRTVLDVWPNCPNDDSTPDGALNKTMSPETGLGQVKLPLAASLPLPIDIGIPGSPRVRLKGRFDSVSNVDALQISVGQAHRYDILSTTSSSWQTSLGLRVNQPETAITMLYGTPDNRIDKGDRGSCYHYKNAGLLVTAQAGLISQLIVYYKYP